MPEHAWPPTIELLLLDAGIDPGEPNEFRDVDRLKVVLDAAVTFVERVRADAFEGVDLEVAEPQTFADLRLGTVRLAYRWHVRRRSPDGLVQMAELGAGRVPSFDPDIERLLGIGKFRGVTFA